MHQIRKGVKGEGKARGGEREGKWKVCEGQGREFGPPQCSWQIDASAHNHHWVDGVKWRGGEPTKANINDSALQNSCCWHKSSVGCSSRALLVAHLCTRDFRKRSRRSGACTPDRPTHRVVRKSKTRNDDRARTTITRRHRQVACRRKPD